MNQLHAIQHQFWNSLRSREASSACTRLFSGDGKITREERLGIYRSTMRTAHARALSNTYPCCEKILGTRYFKQLTNEYFHEHPATHQNLNLYGESFPSFLQIWIRSHAELTDYQYLPDLAKLELAYERAYYAQGNPVFDFKILATLDEDSYRNIHFQLSASLSVLKSIYPVYEIWIANQKQESAKEVNAVYEPQYLCVTRENFNPVVHKIDQTCWWVIQKIQNNFSFGELEILARQEGMNIQLQTVIPELVHKKWICEYQIKA